MERANGDRRGEGELPEGHGIVLVALLSVMFWVGFGAGLIAASFLS